MSSRQTRYVASSEHRIIVSTTTRLHDLRLQVHQEAGDTGPASYGDLGRISRSPKESSSPHRRLRKERRLPRRNSRRREKWRTKKATRCSSVKSRAPGEKEVGCWLFGAAPQSSRYVCNEMAAWVLLL